MYVVPGVIGTMQSLEALKVISGIGSILCNDFAEPSLTVLIASMFFFCP